MLSQVPINNDDVYDEPSPQVILIKGNKSFETVCIPGMQQYYTNVLRTGKDYAYLKLAYFEFPRADSISKVVGNSAELTCTVKWDLGYPPIHPDLTQYTSPYATHREAAVSMMVGIDRIKTLADASSIMKKMLLETQTRLG